MTTKITQVEMNNGVSSQANAGTAGGTMYYVNLGGIKMLWGQSAANVGSTAGPNFGITFPGSFFTTVQSATVSVNSITVVSNQMANLDSVTALGMIYFHYAAATTSAEKVSFIVIGT